MMRRTGYISLLVAFSAFLWQSPVFSAVPVEDARCDAPPFYTAASEAPNIMLVVDVSGSMGWKAYYSGSLSTYRGNEEGYFTPSKTYKFDTSDSVWKEIAGAPSLPDWSNNGYTTLTAASDSSDICPVSTSGISNYRSGNYSFKGSCLNALFMDRIDVARWAITGGRPAGCSSFGDADCDPALATSCDANGCVLELHRPQYGDVQVPQNRIDGFIQSAEGLDSAPRIGASFYSSSSLRSQKVYLGDYPDGNNADQNYRYTYLKRYLNFIMPYGGTPTRAGMEEAYDYFKQANDHSNANGFSLHKTGWQDPLYRCAYDKSGCKAAGWCTKSFVILLSDGSWNSGGDPIRATHQLHTNLGRTFAGHSINIDKVYTIGLFMQGSGINAMQHMAMYGSYDKTATQVWPGGTGGSGYVNHYPNSSLSQPIPTYDEDHPNLDWDKNPTDGVPDTFFAPQNGDDLKRNLFAIFEDIVSNRGAAASVATVTQNVLGEDVVVRGAFFHDPTAAGHRLWEGHLESYWPNGDCLSADNQTDCNTAGCAWDTAASECLPYDYENRPANQVFCAESDDHCWDAYFKLKQQTSRNIFTYIDGQRVDITTANVNQLYPLMANTIDFDLDHDVDIHDTENLITWVREGSKYNWNYTVRDRSGDLGDIVYSAPVIIGSPSLGSIAESVAIASCTQMEPCFGHTDATECGADSAHGCTWNPFENSCQAPVCANWTEASDCNNQPTCAWDGATNTCGEKAKADICAMPGADECFYSYQYCNSKRKKLAVVAANDGMLHAFVVSTWDDANDKWLYDPADDSEIGTEVWAYIPSNLLSELTCLAAQNYGESGGCQHRTTLDLSAMAWDINLETPRGACSGSSTPSSSFNDETSCVDAGYTWACTATTNCSGLDQTSCQAAAGCTPGCGQGSYDCSLSGDQTTCDATPDCSWESECTGQFDCASIADSGDCANANCTWSNQSGCSWDTYAYCRSWLYQDYGCSATTDSSACQNKWWCSWITGGDCTGHFDCSQLDQSSCGNHSQLCRWRNNRNRCVNRGPRNNRRDCDYLQTGSNCNNYQATTGSCVGSADNACSNLDATTCSSVTGCSLAPAACRGTGTCTPGNCQTALGCSETCDGTTTCTDYACQGTLTCSEIGSESSCDDASGVGCSWTPGIAHPWRTVLVGGQRGGGDLYFALDVTDPDNPTLLWEHSVLRNMVALESVGSGRFEAKHPWAKKEVYNELLKTQPFSWSTPYVGKLNLPADLCFRADQQLLYPLSADTNFPDPVCWSEDSTTHQLSGWYAFIGGGTRMYDEDDLPDCSDLATAASCGAAAFCRWDNTMLACNEIPGMKEQLFQPNLLALDMATGINIFQYLWPTVQQAFAAKWPVSAVAGKNIPHSMTTPMVLDIWKGADNSKPTFGKDGSSDHIFAGDITGHYWGISLDSNPNTHQPRVYVDRWQTKKSFFGCSSLTSKTSCEASNACWWDTSGTPSCEEGYGTRGPRQPINSAAEASFDVNKNLRIYFGTGKFENVSGDFNDRSDKGYNAFYNITLPTDHFTSTDDTACTVSGYPQTPTMSCSGKNMVSVPPIGNQDLHIRLQDHSCSDCEGHVGGTADTWITPPDNDTVQADYVGAGCSSQNGTDCGCSNDCYQCVFDLTTPGEKVLGQPLVAGELVFFTTYVPQASTCGTGGVGYVYVADYMCRELKFNPFEQSGLTTTVYYSDTAHTHTSAVRADLGGGMPSRPVIDSTGEHILIQTSDAEIKRIKVNIKVKDYYKGWQEEIVQ